MSKIQITVTDSSNRVFVGIGDVVWSPTRVEDSGASCKPAAIHEFFLSEADGSMLGWTPYAPRGEGDDDEAETETT